MSRRKFPHLTYGGCQVTRVFAVNRTAGTADVLLMTAVVTGSWARVQVSAVAGSGGVRLTDAEIRAELERRAGVCFGAWSAPVEVEAKGAA